MSCGKQQYWSCIIQYKGTEDESNANSEDSNEVKHDDESDDDDSEYEPTDC